MRNLEELNKRGAFVILRCVLIQDINDSQEHLAGIADLAAREGKMVASLIGSWT